MNNSSTIPFNTSIIFVPSCTKPYLPDTIGDHGITLMVLYGILSAFITSTNVTLVIGIVRTKTKAMSNTNKLFIFLACVNLLTALLLLPYQIYMIEITPDTSCIDAGVRAFFVSFLPLLSGAVITLIATERYFLIAYKLMHRKYFSAQRLALYVVLLISMSACWGLAYCFISQDINNLKEISIVFMGLAANEGVLLILALVFNIKILQTVVKARRNFTLSRCNKKTERKLSRTISIICVTLAVCYLPSVVGLANASYYTDKNSIDKVKEAIMTFHWTFLLAYLNSGLNSLIYLVRNEKIKRYLCGTKDHNSNHNKSVSGGNSSPLKKLSVASNASNNIAMRKVSTLSNASKHATTPLKKKISIASISSISSTKQKQQLVNAASSTMEIRNGVLVPKVRPPMTRQDEIVEEEEEQKEIGKENPALEE